MERRTHVLFRLIMLLLLVLLMPLTARAKDGVAINSSASTEVPFNGGKFIGTYSPVAITANDENTLYLGSENKLYYPTADMNINSCRAYFHLDDGNAVKEFVLNYGEDEETPLLSPEGEDIATSPRGGLEGVIYDLSGRKINCQLSPNHSSFGGAGGGPQLPKGLYIVNGNKVAIK